MLFRVSGARFREALIGVAGVGTKKPVNLTFTPGSLRIQSSNIIIVEENIEVLEQDTDYESFSATMNNTVDLIDSDEVLNIAVNGDTMTLSQTLLNYTVGREYAEAIEYKEVSNDYEQIDRNQLSNIVKDIRAIELITKTLGKDAFAVYVYNGRCFIDGQCIAYEAPLNLPNAGVTNKVLKELVRVCRGNTSACVQDKVLSVKSANKRILVATDVVDMQHVKVLQSISSNMKLLTSNFDISPYTGILETFLKVYSGSLANITIGEDGMFVFMDNGEAKVVAGKQVDRICSIQLSMQQAVCMSHIMGSLGGIDIYGGNNKICLVQKSSNKKLTLAGSVY
jgi:hypothetical protein